MSKFYDMIARDYDQLIQNDVLEQKFPYAAYNDIQNMIADYVFENKHLEVAKILDIGIGTGSLYDKIMPEKYTLTGIDNSTKMLDIAKLRYPEATLIEHDLMKGLPEEIDGLKYDYIIINFVFKHFDLDYVTNTINLLALHLAPFGKILVGDLMFTDPDTRNYFFRNYSENILPKYYYHSFSEIVKGTDDEFALSFMEFNGYSGLLIVEKYYESSLHFEESLVKYKTNTVKWKSTQAQKKRE